MRHVSLILASIVEKQRAKIPYRACFVIFWGRKNIAGESSLKYSMAPKLLILTHGSLLPILQYRLFLSKKTWYYLVKKKNDDFIVNTNYAMSQLTMNHISIVISSIHMVDYCIYYTSLLLYIRIYFPHRSTSKLYLNFPNICNT